MHPGQSLGGHAGPADPALLIAMPVTAKDVADTADELTERREPFVWATVVRAKRPTIAQAGDTAVVLATGEVEGFVGGNCVEASVREYALRALDTCEPVLLRIAPGTPSHMNEEGAVQVTNPCVSGGEIEIFLEPHIPAPRVVVVGTTPIAHALMALGAILGFEMEPAEGSATTPTRNDAALIVASHGWEEEPALEAALKAEVPYIALVASSIRSEAVLASLDVNERQRSHVHSPAGINLGARTPAEIALSILAQLVQERTQRRKAQSGLEPPVTRVRQAIDPVCGMTVVAVESSLHAEHDGQTVYFCSPGCRSAYLASPERYAVAS